MIVLMAILASLLFMFAVTVLGWVAAKNMLRVDTESTVSTWIPTLLGSPSDIPDMAAGKAPSKRTEDLLKGVGPIGNIYRFRIWSKTGIFIFSSDRTQSSRSPATLAERCGRQIADSILSGHPYTEMATGKTPWNPSYFADSYIPIKQNEAVVGVVEVQLNQTEHLAFYEDTFLFNEGLLTILVLLAGGTSGYFAYRKMMVRQTAQAQALFLAEHDSLTSIANRKLLEETAKRALAWTHRNKSYVAAMALDMDRFKEVNDGFGHGAGDKVLQAFALRVESTIRTEDMVARIGGDEFVVLQVGMPQPSGASALTDRLMSALSKPYEIGGLTINCGVSIGVAIAPTDAEEWDVLLTRADAALYKAKNEGRNTVVFFETGIEVALRDRRRLKADLQRALETKAFQLAYQPLFSLHDGGLLGFEALLRWPEGWAPRSPEVFIPVAEESDLIIPVGAWILETACRTAASWTKPLKIAVNLSPVQFRNGDLVAVVKEALNVSGLAPERLELEVTESLWLQDTNAVLDQLSQLRMMGISIALDDFGTGYSSLAYLWRFPFDRLKIDRSFVMNMENDKKAKAVIGTIIELGAVLDISITAEGIETQEQFQTLKEAGCDQAQGFLLGPPLSTKLANALVDADRAPIGE